MIDILNPGGRLCIITFHSLEDRIVKSAFKKNENPCTCPSHFPVCVCGKNPKGKVITRKPIVPSDEELGEGVIFMKECLQIISKRYVTRIDSTLDIVHNNIYCNAIVLKQLAVFRQEIEFFCLSCSFPYAPTQKRIEFYSTLSACLD